MNIIANEAMRDIIVRSGVDSRYALGRRFKAVKLARAGASLRLKASSRYLPLPPHSSLERAVDRDVGDTRVEFSRTDQRNYVSAAFRALWTIASASGDARSGICGIVAIFDAVIAEEVAKRSVRPLPGCAVCFFRGKPGDYFDDIEETLGANAIVELDSIAFDEPYSKFVETIGNNVPCRADKR